MSVRKINPMTTALLVFSIVFSFAASHAQAQVTLKESFDSAVNKTETLPIEDARTRQAEEQLRQGYGGVLPHIGFRWDYLRQEQPILGTAAGGLGSTLARSDQVTTRLTATQHLFQGLKEFSGISSLQSSLQAQRYTVENTRLGLFASVANVFFSTLAAEKDLVNLNTLIDISERRIKELQAFTRLGRSRRSDLLASQTQLATLRAQAAGAESTRRQTRERYSFVTGLAADSKLNDAPVTLPERLNPVETYLAALEERPDLKALQEQERAAEANVRLAKGNYWPTLDLTGNYYLHRSGYLESSHWDVGLTLTIPIYEGGSQVSQVRQVYDILTERRLLLEQARRSAHRDLMTAYEAASMGLAQFRLISDALKIARQTYEQTSHDYRVGAITNLEVLQALGSLEDAQRAFDQSYYQNQIALVNLSIAQGKIPGL